MNFSFTQTSTDDAFINRIKQSQIWTSSDIGPDHGAFNFDSNGYPTTIPAAGQPGSSGVATVFFIAPQTLKPGDYYLMWSGGGSLFFSGCSPIGGGTSLNSLLSNGANGTYSTVLRVNGQERIFWGINGVGSDGSHVHDVAFVHQDDMATWNGGEKFWSPQLITILRYLNPGVIRFLDWQNANDSNMTDWASRKAITHWAYNAHEIRPAFWAGSVTNVGMDYTGSLGAGAPTSKQLAHIRFPTTANVVEHIVTISTANPAVIDFGAPVPTEFVVGGPITVSADGFPPPPMGNSIGMFVKTISGNTCTVSFTVGGPAVSTVGTIGSTGAITATRPPRFRLNPSDTYRPILNVAGSPSRPNNNQVPIAGHIGTGMFDAEMNAWLLFGGTLSVQWAGLNNCVPIELMFDLCAKIGAHPWFCLPGYAADPKTDLFDQVAIYHRDNIKPTNAWMIPRFEGPNEVWSSAGFQTGYAYNKSMVDFGVPQDGHDWYGKVMSTMGQAINAVYGGPVDPNSSPYNVVLGTQNLTGGAAFGGPTQNDARMTSPLWVAQTSAAQAAHNWVTHHCTGGYINSATLYVGCKNVINGFNFLVTNAGNAAAQAVILDAYGADYFLQANNVVDLFAHPLFLWAANFKTKDGFAIQSYGYEGGPADDYAPGPVYANITAVTREAQAHVTLDPATVSIQFNPPSDTSTNPNGLPFTAGMLALVGTWDRNAGVFGQATGMTQINNDFMINALVLTPGNPNIPFTGRATVGMGFWMYEDDGSPLPPDLPGINVDGNFYYIVANTPGVSIQISRTKGGPPITPDGPGAHTALMSQTGWKVLSVTGNVVVLDCDSTLFSPYTGNGKLVVAGGDVYLNAMRANVRFSQKLADSMLQYYQKWLVAGGFYPPQYSFAVNTMQVGSRVIDKFRVWGMMNSVYAALPPYAVTIHNFNIPTP